MRKCKMEKKRMEKAETKESVKLISVGIDVSMENLMICKFYSNGKKEIKEIENKESVIEKFAKELKGTNYQGKIIMESTGRHHMIGAVVLSENDLDVRVINPLIAKKYSSSSIRKVKTDKKDSEILAEIGIKENNLPNKFYLDRKGLSMCKKMRLIASLSKQLQNLSTIAKEHQKTIEGLNCNLSKTEKLIFKTIDKLKKQKELLEAELENDIRLDDQNKKLSEKYNSVPGVSPYLASLSAFIFSKDHSDSSKQWIAFVGMDVSVKESGNWKGKGKLTKRGNNCLRQRLFSAAWGAMMHNDKFKEYYNYLRNDKHRSYRAALIIIARKIIKIMFSLFKNNSVYDSSKPLFTAS
jgi:transposase